VRDHREVGYSNSGSNLEYLLSPTTKLMRQQGWTSFPISCVYQQWSSVFVGMVIKRGDVTDDNKSRIVNIPQAYSIFIYHIRERI
jgi:hypothetical protein